MARKKSDAGYRAALAGAKGVVRLLLYICVIFVILLAAKTSYQFGHDVFAEEPVGLKGKGKEANGKTYCVGGCRQISKKG